MQRKYLTIDFGRDRWVSLSWFFAYRKKKKHRDYNAAARSMNRWD